jgi:hypothetical protein
VGPSFPEGVTLDKGLPKSAADCSDVAILGRGGVV